MNENAVMNLLLKNSKGKLVFFEALFNRVVFLRLFYLDSLSTYATFLFLFIQIQDLSSSHSRDLDLVLGDGSVISVCTHVAS